MVSMRSENMKRSEEDVARILVGENDALLRLSGVLNSSHSLSVNLRWSLEESYQWKVAVTGTRDSVADNQVVLRALRQKLESMGIPHKVFLRCGDQMTWLPEETQDDANSQFATSANKPWHHNIHNICEYTRDGHASEILDILAAILESARPSLVDGTQPKLLEKIKNIVEDASRNTETHLVTTRYTEEADEESANAAKDGDTSESKP